MSLHSFALVLHFASNVGPTERLNALCEIACMCLDLDSICAVISIEAIITMLHLHVCRDYNFASYRFITLNLEYMTLDSIFQPG